MKYFFWNTKKNANIEVICKIGEVYQPDFIILAEYPLEDTTKLIEEINRVKSYYIIPVVFNQRITIISSLKPSKVELYKESSYYRFVRIYEPDIQQNLNIGCLHFPSKLFADDDSISEVANKMSEYVKTIEDDITTTLLIGDFNMNPFEKGMLSLQGLHAYPQKEEANKREITLYGEKYKTFYNPMWKFLGDENTGLTYFYSSKSKPHSLYWNIFDQFLLRPEIIDFMKEIEIVKKVDNFKFLIDGKPNKQFSDHLPIFLKLDD